MSLENFNRLHNPSREDFNRFVGWLFSHTLAQLRAARGNDEATRVAWVEYFRRGIHADLLLDELMQHVPELFRRVHYADCDVPTILEMIKSLSMADLGVGPAKAKTISEESEA